MPSDVRRLTFALLNPETAPAAADALRGVAGKDAVDGLVHLLCGPHPARAGIAAVAALRGRDDPGVADGLRAALRSSHANVRQAGVDALRQETHPALADDLARLLRTDPSWPVRRSALAALANAPGDVRWSVLIAATDPHWRVRNELVLTLLPWGDTLATRQRITAALLASAPGETAAQAMRRVGVRAVLVSRWEGALPVRTDGQPHQFERGDSPLDDPDPAVVLREWQRLSRPVRRAHVRLCPRWLNSREPRLVAAALDALGEWGEVDQLLAAAAWLDDPREGAAEAALRLLESLDADRTERLARAILSHADASPPTLAWAIDRFGEAFAFHADEPGLCALLAMSGKHDPMVGSALIRLAGRWRWPDAGPALAKIAAGDSPPSLRLEALQARFENGLAPDGEALEPLLDDPEAKDRAAAYALAVRFEVARDRWTAAAHDPAWEVRQALAQQLAAREPIERSLLDLLAADDDPRVRAAALTVERAARLVERPEEESSWHVLARAAVLARVPFWKLAPADVWQPTTVPQPEPEPFRAPRPEPAVTRPLGPKKLSVFPMGVSGHYGLPAEGFARAAEAGVNLFFWEPEYRSLSGFMRRLPAGRRSDFHVVAGTFEAEPRRIRADAERALRMLGLERIAVFLLFWVRSWERATPEVRTALERMQAQGMIGAFGLSTHSRSLAVQAIEAGWDPVMVRHSAAHPGAEWEVFPRARDRGTSILTFSNTCYGRLLRPGGGQPGQAAADCYRYTLGQPGVRACFSAPATCEQLEENLSAVQDPVLPEDRREQLLARGAALHQEESAFRQWIRSV